MSRISPLIMFASKVNVCSAVPGRILAMSLPLVVAEEGAVVEDTPSYTPIMAKGVDELTMIDPRALEVVATV